MLTDRSSPFAQISCWAISYRRTVAITGLRCEPCVGGVHSSFLAGGVRACLGAPASIQVWGTGGFCTAAVVTEP